MLVFVLAIMVILNGCLYADWGDAACKLRWRPNLASGGNYRVSVWFGGDPTMIEIASCAFSPPLSEIAAVTLPATAWMLVTPPVILI